MMVKRIVVFIGIVALTIPLIGSVASALPNFALSASPQVVDFGNVRPVLGIVSQTVTISNVSASNLAGGVYSFRGDVNLPGGFNVNPDPGFSNCIAAGGSLSGITRGLLSNGRGCTFTVRFDPTQLPEGGYTGRLNVTIGESTIRVLAFAQVVRLVG